MNKQREVTVHVKRAKNIICLFIAVIITFFAGISHSAVYADTYSCSSGNHKDVVIEMVPATVTADGHITYRCEICNRTYTDIVFSTGHNWGQWVTDIEASCIYGGTRHRTCTIHGVHDQYEDIPAAGHSYKETVIQPTCVKAGIKQFECVNCSHSYEEPYGKATGIHQYEETITKRSSCAEAGEKTFTCKICGDSYTQTFPATGHSYGGWIVEAEAKEGIPGRQYKECEYCKDRVTETIPALAVAATMAETQPEPEPEPIFNSNDAVIAGTNFSFLIVLGVLIAADVRLILWDKNRKKNLLKKRRAQQAMEADDGFIFG